MRDQTEALEAELRSNIGPWTVEFQGRISRDADALLLVRGEVTAEAIEKLIENLKLYVDEFPRQESLTSVDILVVRDESELLPEEGSQ